MMSPGRCGIGLALAACASLALASASLAAPQSGTGKTDDLLSLLDTDAEVVCEDGVCRLVPRSGTAVDAAEGGELQFPGYTVAANGMGERSAEELVALLEGREAPRRSIGLWGRFAAAFFGGILLNLTPCVLPMVPVTLMVLGIGLGARRRRGGVWTGLAYGGGIAVAYGALGVVSLAAGTAFGTLQSSPWFSAAVCVAMVALSLAMFGVFRVDFSKYRPAGSAGGGERSGLGRLAAAFAAGIGFAVLAGACVAPVVLETLVASLALQAEGRPLAWALPFALGIGMGFPWVLLGAGLSRWLPKPGRWMVWVERGFGVVAIAFALHYGWLAWNGFAENEPTISAPGVARNTPPGGSAATPLSEGGIPQPQQSPFVLPPSERGDAPKGQGGVLRAAETPPQMAGIAWRTDAGEAFREAEASGKPIFVDLWATWCRSCEAMERGTLRDPKVAEAVSGMVPLRLQCEDLNSPEAVALFRELGFTTVRGLPAYAVLRRE